MKCNSKIKRLKCFVIQVDKIYTKTIVLGVSVEKYYRQGLNTIVKFFLQ